VDYYLPTGFNMRSLLLALVVALASAEFNPAAPASGVTFTKSTSYRFLYYSYAAYNTPTSWNCAYCTNYTAGFVLTNVCKDSAAGSWSYVGYNPNYSEIVASFRGSSDIQNWIEDVTAIKTPPGQAFPGLPNSRVEVGFWTYWNSVKSCVTSAIKNLRSAHPTYSTFTTGHSLGAAASTLAAMDMIVNLGMPGVQVLNYGQPRVGNQDFATNTHKYISGLQRMVDNKDIVPSVPPQALGYEHETTEIWETPSGGANYKVCSSTNGEDPTCSDSVVSDSTADHLIYMGVPCCSHP